MMRMRRASVITMLSLLCWTAPASAECAWVLWEQGLLITPSSDGPRSSELFDPVGTHDSRQECEGVAQAMERNIQRPESGYTRTTEGLYMKKSFNTLRVHGLYKCLPDTVDPRGPKGK